MAAEAGVAAASAAAVGFGLFDYNRQVLSIRILGAAEHSAIQTLVQAPTTCTMPNSGSKGA